MDENHVGDLEKVEGDGGEKVQEGLLESGSVSSCVRESESSRPEEAGTVSEIEVPDPEIGVEDDVAPEGVLGLEEEVGGVENVDGLLVESDDRVPDTGEVGGPGSFCPITSTLNRGHDLPINSRICIGPLPFLLGRRRHTPPLPPRLRPHTPTDVTVVVVSSFGITRTTQVTDLSVLDFRPTLAPCTRGISLDVCPPKL